MKHQNLRQCMNRVIVLLMLAIIFQPELRMSRAAQAAIKNEAPPGPEQSLLAPEGVLKALVKQKELQLSAIRSCTAYYDFQFIDRIEESQIRFEHHVVDDAGKHYKPVHYDHGNGLAVADVDGDGRLDIYFTSQLGGNQLWRNRGGGKFEDITSQSGLGLKDQISVAAAFADIDNDGDPDLFVTTVRKGNHLFRNQGQGRFEDVTQEAGLSYSGHSSGAVFFDFDRDGLLDLFLCNVGVYTTENKGRGDYYVGVRDAFSGHIYPERSEFSVLYRNIGSGKFKDVSREMNLRDSGWAGDATFTDLNEDGYPDLYVLNMQGDDHYYENQNGKHFLEKTAVMFPKTPWGAMGVKFFDFNQDGRMDLFITDMHSDMTDQANQNSRVDMRRSFEKQKAEAWCSTQYTDAFLQGASNNIFGNAFYRNDGGGKFVEISDRIGAETFWPWGMSVDDLNADGYDDVFVTAGMGFGFRYGRNSVLLNDRGEQFFDSEFVLGVEPRKDQRIEKLAFILDCAGADRNHPYCVGQTGQIPVGEALSSRSSAICDLDEDGDLDIVTIEMNDRSQVLMSNLAERRSIRFLKVKLMGTKSNRDGLGATVRVGVKDRVLTRYHDGKSGYFGQSSMPLYFGLGEADSVSFVEVKWPSGKKQRLTANVKSNETLIITELVE
ncbi:MAG: CRTAC1 family protein [Verrucomicrobiota bacterium]|jgi:enediyne biosynthesis protein E4